MSTGIQQNIYNHFENTNHTSHYLQLPPNPFSGSKHHYIHRQTELVQHKPGIYSWDNKRHQCYHDTTLQIPSILVTNSSCAVLSYFNSMYYSPIVQCVICLQHQTAIPFNSLAHHIKIFHSSQYTQAKHPISTLINHIGSAFSLLSTQSAEEITITVSRIQLTEPIPGLQLPKKHTQCPGCSSWFDSFKHTQKHLESSNTPSCQDWLRNHPVLYNTTFPTRYISPLFTLKGLATTYVVFAKDYAPPNPTTAASTQATRILAAIEASSPEYIVKFGWESYVYNLGAELPVLILLHTTPGARMIQLWPKDSEGASIEEGLVVVSQFLTVYLREADSRVNGCHDMVRQAITNG